MAGFLSSVLNFKVGTHRKLGFEQALDLWRRKLEVTVLKTLVYRVNGLEPPARGSSSSSPEKEASNHVIFASIWPMVYRFDTPFTIRKLLNL